MSQKNQFVEWNGSMDVKGSSIDRTIDTNKEHLFLEVLEQILKRFKYTSAEALCRYSTVVLQPQFVATYLPPPEMMPFCDLLLNTEPLGGSASVLAGAHTLTYRKLCGLISFGPRHIFRCQGSEEWPGFVRSISWETEHTAVAL